jgi:hypothetical protein
MDPMKPETTGEAGAPTMENVAAKLDEADKSGALQKLKDLMAEQGWDEPVASIMMLAQKDDRTKAKSPDELADMMSQDPSLYDDLVAYKPGGALEKLAKGGESESEKEPAVEVEINAGGESESEPSDEETSAMLEGSSSMKGMPVDKAKSAMKSTGFNPAKDGKDYEKKKRFMSAMYQE